MSQKINSIGFRVGVIHDWEVKWYTEKDSASLLHRDLRIRKFTGNELKGASVSHVDVERVANRVNTTIYTGKSGMVTSKGGLEAEKLRNKLNILTDKKVHINVTETKGIDINIRPVAKNIARQLESRASFRRIQEQVITRTMKNGAKGTKTQVSGRLDGADIARAEQYLEGTVLFHILRADIDYAHAEADTAYGKLGARVWICRGEALPTKNISGGGK